MKSLSTPLLDYRFGWRWLLPYALGQSLYLSGFNKAEQAFWHDAVVSAKWVQVPTLAEGWIVNTDRLASGAMEGLMASLPDTVQWVVCVGTGEAARRLRRQLTNQFAMIHEYGLLPAATPRLVIPFGKPRHAVTALTLHRPGRWTARLVVRLAATLARFGVYFPLRRRVLLVATRAPSLRPIGALQAGGGVHLGGEGWDFALYLGTPNDNRKTVVLPLGRAIPAVLIKMGESIQARQALHNEATALSFLANPSLQSFNSRQGTSRRRESNGQAGSEELTDHLHDRSLAGQVPLMIRLVENEHGVALYQEYRPRLKVRPSVLADAVVDFLAQLSTIDRHSRLLQEVLAEMTAVAGPSGLTGGEEPLECSIWRWLRRRAEEGAVVYEHRSHGDFAPWNCAWTAQGFFVFDWEESHHQALAFGDAFYFVLASALHVAGKQSPLHVQANALILAGQVAKRGVVIAADVNVHFALWLLGKHAAHPGYARFIEQLAKELSACTND